jgi:hypothetical protein
MHVIRLIAAILLALPLAGCLKQKSAPVQLPAMVLGTFTDDYGSQYAISPTQWHQGKGAYRIVKVNAAAMYLIAQNDSNTTDRGKWTRIDWVPLAGMPPWEWAYCYGAFDAPSLVAAEAVTVARRESPRTGCNGFPFSRMKRVP